MDQRQKSSTVVRLMKYEIMERHTDKSSIEAGCIAVLLVRHTYTQGVN